MKKNIFNAFILMVICGFIESYSYLVHDGVFANMQTGNIGKLGIELASGNFAVKYFMPILAFFVGIVMCKLLEPQFKSNILPILIEILLIVPVGFICGSFWLNVISNCILSVICAIQFMHTRSCGTLNYTAIMCTNNLRLCGERLVDGFTGENNVNKLAWLFYFCVILFFFCGCVIGGIASRFMKQYAIFLIIPLFLISLILTGIAKLSLKNKEVDSCECDDDCASVD